MHIYLFSLRPCPVFLSSSDLTATVRDLGMRYYETYHRVPLYILALLSLLGSSALILKHELFPHFFKGAVMRNFARTPSWSLLTTSNSHTYGQSSYESWGMHWQPMLRRIIIAMGSGLALILLVQGSSWMYFIFLGEIFLTNFFYYSSCTE